MTPYPTLAPRANGTTRTGRATRLTARAMARLYTDYLSALWRGDDVADVTTWLEARWSHHGPPQPEDTPDAVSLLGEPAGGENRVRWYQRGNTILGYPSGQRRGAYRIPATETPPSLTH